MGLKYRRVLSSHSNAWIQLHGFRSPNVQVLHLQALGTSTGDDDFTRFIAQLKSSRILDLIECCLPEKLLKTLSPRKRNEDGALSDLSSNEPPLASK
jgi:hypothetical protein